MRQSIAPKIYRTNLHAFIDKAFRSAQGKKLNPDQSYITFVVSNLEQFVRGDINELLVNLPGRHLKTFMCSVCLPAFMLGLDPTLKFMIVAYNEELAEDIVRQIREIMETNWYKSAFRTRLAAGHSRKDDFIIVGGGRVRAVPVRSVTGKGGDVVIFDDPHNVDDWDNDRKKEKVIEAFELLVSRRDGGKMSQMLVVCHRVGRDDLSAHILDRGDFKHVCLPLFAPEDMTFNIGHGTWQLAKGESLRADAFPPEEIESIRRHHRGPPFWLYYQQGLGPKKDDHFIEVSHFPFLERENIGDILATGVPVVLSVDPAQQTNSGSRNVIHVYAIRGNYYDLLQAFAEKCSFGRLLNKVKYFATRYQASLVIVENTARGPDLIEKLRRDMSIPVTPVNPRGTKAARLRACAPIIRAKRVRIRQDRPNVEEAVNEIVAYPNCAYDDHVDTLTNFLAQAANFTTGSLAHGSTFRPRPSSNGLIAIARRRSIFDSARPLPHFSIGSAEAPSRLEVRTPFIVSFDGTKIVLLK